MNKKHIMQYKEFALIIVIFIALLASCETDEKNDCIAINLVNPELSKYKLSDICDSLFYIPLKSDYGIRYLNEIQMDDSIIFCATQPEGILAFNFKGQFLKRIGKRGRGPGEYQTGIRFCLDKMANYIYVDNGMGKILKFNYQGDLLKEIEIKTKVSPGFIDFADNFFVFSYPIVTSTIKTPYQWIITDSLSNMVSQKSNDNYIFHNNGPTPSGELTYMFNNKIHYWNHYNDTIFQITSKNLQPKYILDKGKMGPSPEKLSNLIRFNDIRDYIIIRKIIECSNFLFIIYYFQNQREIVMFDKYKKISYNIKSAHSIDAEFTNDIDGGLNFLPFKSTDSLTLVMPIDVYKITQIGKTIDFKNSTPKHPEKKKELVQLANSLNENDNPVLMMVKLKD